MHPPFVLCGKFVTFHAHFYVKLIENISNFLIDKYQNANQKLVKNSKKCEFYKYFEYFKYFSKKTEYFQNNFEASQTEKISKKISKRQLH